MVLVCIMQYLGCCLLKICRKLQDGHVVSVVEVLVIIQYSVLVEVGMVCKKCSGTKGSMFKVMKLFIYRHCLNPVTSTGCTSVDIGASANLELVDKFCYLGDMLSVDEDADAALEARIRIGWNKFWQLVTLLTNKDISLIMRGRPYSSCMQSSMLHESEIWPVRKENDMALQRAEMQMVK